MPANITRILTVRGGKIKSFFDSGSGDQEEDGDEDEDEDEDELNGHPLFGSVTIPPIITDTWRNTPPVTRSFLSASLLLAVLSNLFNNNNFPQLLEMDLPAVLQKLQV